jgi:hypothetical protein
MKEPRDATLCSVVCAMEDGGCVMESRLLPIAPAGESLVAQ